MSITALLFGGLCGVVAWKQDYTPPFTQEQLKSHVEDNKRREYNDYCKLAAGKGILSNKQLTRKQYDGIISQGWVRSRDKHDNLCWYNRKKNNTKFISDLVRQS